MRKIPQLFLVAPIIFSALFCSASAAAQQLRSKPRTATLEARRTTENGDNYAKAAFSFQFGLNGDEGFKATRNNWDVLFGNSWIKGTRNSIDVTMISDDRSRIIDLGGHSWKEHLSLPILPAYDKPTREPAVEAVVGHIYLVHVCDRDNDHYAVFRVENLIPNQRLTISWKLIPIDAVGKKL